MKMLWWVLLWLPLLSAAQDKVLMREGYFIHGTIDSFAEKSLFIVMEENNERRQVPSVMINKVYINNSSTGRSFTEAKSVFTYVPQPKKEEALAWALDSATNQGIASSGGHLVLAGKSLMKGVNNIGYVVLTGLFTGAAYPLSNKEAVNLRTGAVIGGTVLSSGFFIASMSHFSRAGKHLIQAGQGGG